MHFCGHLTTKPPKHSVAAAPTSVTILLLLDDETRATVSAAIELDQTPNGPERRVIPLPIQRAEHPHEVAERGD